MYRFLRNACAGFALVFVVATGSVAGQGALSSGSLSGQVSDATGAAVPSATLTLTSPASNGRTATTGPDGSFNILGLASGTYQVQISAPGFQTLTLQGVAVATGRVVQLAPRLQAAGASTTISVSANAATGLDAAQTSSTANIDRDRIEELPVPSRNYLSFVLLAPQAAPANPAIGQHTLSGGEGGFSFGGLRTGSNAVYIDGTSDDDEYTGESRTELSPEAINDFQIVNHGFNAESGGAAGGSIDVQTRMGTNVQHGDAFMFVQNGALNANPALEILPHKPDESRLRAGLSTGGPVVRNRTFYYVAAEQELARGEDANGLAPGVVGAINSSLPSAAFPGLRLQTGFFPTTNQQLEFSSRLDHALTPHHNLMLRYALTNTRSVNDAFHTDDLADRSSRGSSFVLDNSLTGALTSTLSATLVNRLDMQLAQRRAVNRTEDNTPGVSIPGVALFGTPYDGNSRRFETHGEVSDNVMEQRGRHTLTAGIGLSHVALRAAVRDGFAGLYVFPGLAEFASGDPSFFLRSYGNPNTNLAELRSYAFAQDHWTPLPSLALDLGVRYDFNALPAPLPQHALNLAPRVGLAWSPSAAWVIRAGLGLFYDRFELSTLNRLLEFNGTRGFQQIAEGPAAAALYRIANGSQEPQPLLRPSIFQSSQELANPYSEVASFGVERALPGQWTLKAEGQMVHGVHLGRTANVNLLPPEEDTPGREIFSALRRNPAYDAISQFSTSAGSSYRGATFTVNRQFTDDFQVMAGYTFSRTTDDASYDAEQPQNPYAPGAERAYSLEDQRHRLVLSGLYLVGPDPDDAVGPKPSAPGRLLRALYGFEFGPIFSASSGFRANPVTGQDSNAEHIYPFAARPLAPSAGGSGATLARNSLETAPQIHLDFRVLKLVPIGRGHLDIVAESFNLLNHANTSLLNTVFGSGSAAQPGYNTPIATADARRVQFSLDFEY